MRLIDNGWRLTGFFLLVMIIGIGPVHAAPVTVFSDNFDDNALDSAKWTADVFGTNNIFLEQNQRAEFQTFGPVGGGWHSFLNSAPILINGWDSIEITGRWTNTGTTSRTHIATITDLDTPTNFVSIEYSAWGSTLFYYSIEHPTDDSLNPPPSQIVSPPPTDTLVPFRLIITKEGFDYYENNVLRKSITTTSMADTGRFQLQIGAWEYSGILSQTHIDDIVVQANYPAKDDPVNAPEFPSAFLPAVFMIGFLGAVLIIRSTREH